MALTVVALAVGVVLGRLLLQPLRYRHLGPARVRWPIVLGLGVVLAVTADFTASTSLAIISQALLTLGVLGNGHLVGTGVLAVGLAMNLVSMTVDGGVPVRRGALVAAGVLDPEEVARATVSGPRHLERDDDLLPWLGDALPVAPLRTVVSFGDLVVAVGVADVAAHAARRRRQSINSASPVHDWGTAPPAAPVSAFHHSARPDVRAPATVGLARVVTPARQSR